MPEVNLENLIRQLKEEGVDKANSESAQIIDGAKKQAEAIITGAQTQAKEIVMKAAQESTRLKDSAIADIKQAGHNVVLLVKAQLAGIAERAYAQNISGALTPLAISEIIVKIAGNWSADKALTVTVSKADEQALTALLPAALRAIGREIEIKTNANLTKGFHLTVAGDGVVYDFSDEAVFASIKELVSPALKDILNHG